MESTKLEKTISIKSTLKKLVAEVHKCTEREKELEEQIEEKRNKAKDYANNGEVKKGMIELKLKKQLTIDLETIINLKKNIKKQAVLLKRSGNISKGALRKSKKLYSKSKKILRTKHKSSKYKKRKNKKSKNKKKKLTKRRR